MNSLLRTLTILALAAVPYLSSAQNAPAPAAEPAKAEAAKDLQSGFLNAKKKLAEGNAQIKLP